jgi:hypothetical protein
VKADQPPGDVTMTVLMDIGRLRIVRADPQIGISAPLLRMMRAGDRHPDVTIDGDVLTINAVNRRLVYRIGEYHPIGLPDSGENGWWYAEWPD